MAHCHWPIVARGVRHRTYFGPSHSQSTRRFPSRCAAAPDNCDKPSVVHRPNHAIFSHTIAGANDLPARCRTRPIESMGAPTIAAPLDWSSSHSLYAHRSDARTSGTAAPYLTRIRSGAVEGAGAHSAQHGAGCRLHLHREL